VDREAREQLQPTLDELLELAEPRPARAAA